MRLQLATRIFVGYALVLLSFGAVALFAIAEMRRTRLDVRLLSEGYLHLSQTAAAIETFHRNQERDTTRLGEEKSVETRRAMIRLARLYFPGLMNEKLKEGRQLAQGALTYAPASEQTFLNDVAFRFDELQHQYAEYQTLCDEAFTPLESENPDWNAVAPRLTRLRQKESTLGTAVRLLHSSLEARILEQAQITQSRERTTGLTIIALALIAVFVGVVATTVSFRSLRPVATLIQGVARVRRGDYSARLNLSGDDEIATLAREFDGMALSLRERELELASKQKELVQAERLAAVGRMAAQVAHEVRNPLSSIGLNAEMLEEQLGAATFLTDAHRREALELIRVMTHEVDRLTELTEEYLRLARLPTPQRVDDDVHVLLTRVAEFMAPEFARSKIRCVLDLSAVHPRAAFDEGQLRQVLLNLLRNAREAMPGGGDVTLRTRDEPNLLAIDVTDSGQGMSDETRARLFEPFFTTKAAGTGLGLSLAKQIIEAHGGSLSVQPSSSAGTTFTLRLRRS